MRTSMSSKGKKRSASPSPETPPNKINSASRIHKAADGKWVLDFFCSIYLLIYDLQSYDALREYEGWFTCFNFKITHRLIDVRPMLKSAR
jgi:hypothetical protein